MKNSPSLALLLALMLLLHEPVTALNWQGTGTVSDQKLAFIWNYIQGNLLSAKNTGTMKNFNDGLSAALNTAYDPAWNTVTAMFFQYNPPYNDLVLYGYAFKDQWMWFNGFKMAGINGNSFSFIVWKDYNCQTWKTLADGASAADQPSGFNSDQKTVLTQWIASLKATQLLEDPWGVTKSLIDHIQGSSRFVVSNDRAYSVILQQQSYYQIDLYARLCVVGQEFYDSSLNYSDNLVTSAGSYYGRFIVFRTR